MFEFPAEPGKKESDGNVSYYTGKHTLLFIIGLIFCSFALV